MRDCFDVSVYACQDVHSLVVNGTVLTRTPFRFDILGTVPTTVGILAVGNIVIRY